jgi:hypothetical protein
MCEKGMGTSTSLTMSKASSCEAAGEWNRKGRVEIASLGVWRENPKRREPVKTRTCKDENPKRQGDRG